jgi:hypothetical protein
MRSIENVAAIIALGQSWHSDDAPTYWHKDDQTLTFEHNQVQGVNAWKGFQRQP